MNYCILNALGGEGKDGIRPERIHENSSRK